MATRLCALAMPDALQSQDRRPFTRPVAQSDLALAASRMSRLRLFVAGPAVKLDWSPEELANKRPSVRLRLSIIDHVRSLEHDFVLGEHRGMKEIAEKNIPSVGTIALSEVATINGCHAVVLVPDSPGSFCELGTWSAIPKISSKMLILSDKTYEEESSYMASTLTLAIHHGARLSWIDYNDLPAARAILDRFIGEIHDRKMVHELLRD